MSPPAAVTTEIEQAVEQLRSGDRFLLTTHENPDGDALGSLLSMHLVLRALGKDSVMFLASKEFPLPVEYRFLPLEEVFHEPPADFADRTLIFLDCGNVDRMPVDFLKDATGEMLNIDHHHDNTRFGSINLVDVEASCTTEIVYELIGLLGVELTPDIASALYVGLVTDTGRFMYSNTDARAHRMAAALIEAGVDVHEHFRRLYEHVPVTKLKLISRALEKIEMKCEDELAITYLSVDDYKEVGASPELTEGVIDYLRSIEAIKVAAVVRDVASGDGIARKVSLRSADGELDVSEIARKQGGGGHTRAAGFATEMTYAEIVEYVCAEISAQT